MLCGWRLAVTGAIALNGLTKSFGGVLAAQHGVVLHGLEGTADLEQAFFRLIEESGPAKPLASSEGALS